MEFASVSGNFFSSKASQLTAQKFQAIAKSEIPGSRQEAVFLEWCHGR
jgi:hypothetical protein